MLIMLGGIPFMCYDVRKRSFATTESLDVLLLTIFIGRVFLDNQVKGTIGVVKFDCAA